MAAKKKASKAIAVRGTGSEVGHVNDWKERLRQKAEKEEQRLAPVGGSNISTRNGQFSVGGDVLGKELEVVILNHARWKTYYDRPFDPDNPTVPACFAVSSSCDRESVNSMEPEDIAPAKQNDICFTCDQNQFGSALQGDGKACRDQIHLAVIAADDLGDDEPEVRILSVPPTSMGQYNMAAKKATKVLKVPLWACVTKVTIVPHKAAFRLEFEIESLIEDDDKLAMLEQKAESILETLMELPDVSLYEPPAKNKRTPPGRTSVKRK